MAQRSDSHSLARIIRKVSLGMVYSAHASHIGSALSIADIVAVLYSDFMKFDPRDPLYANRDRFILSKGHACVAVYAALSAVGFFEPNVVDTYGSDGAELMAHISHKVPGVEFSTGSLGHGLPFGVGKALVAKRKNENWKTLVLISDGELDEGSNWEALMLASHHDLRNITLIVDYNKLQSLGTVQSTVALEPLNEKFSSFGWGVLSIDGHDHSQIKDALRESFYQARPTCILANTVKGKGVSFMENKVAWHYKSPNPQELQSALREVDNA